MSESFETQYVLLVNKSIFGFGFLRVWRIPAPEGSSFRFIVTSESYFYANTEINPNSKKGCFLVSDETKAFNEAMYQLQSFESLYEGYLELKESKAQTLF